MACGTVTEFCESLFLFLTVGVFVFGGAEVVRVWRGIAMHAHACSPLVCSCVMPVHTCSWRAWRWQDTDRVSAVELCTVSVSHTR